MPEKNLDDFFRREDGSSKTIKTVKVREKENKERIRKDNRFLKFFRDRFSFDENVDLTDKCSVLSRRNIVIKNIIFLVNLVFTIFSFVGIRGAGFTSNLIISVVFWLIMTGMSIYITVMIKNKTEDYSHQKAIMYVQSFYVFFLSIFLYIKTWLSLTLNAKGSITNSQFAITQAAYVLIYMSILVISLYQRPKLMLRMAPIIFIFMTIVHITFLHPELYSNANSVNDFLHYIFVEDSKVIIDIGLRTLVLIVFFAGLYSSVSISEYIARERRSEFSKRVNVESDYVDVVKAVFEAVKVYSSDTNEFTQAIVARKVANISREMAVAMNYNPSDIEDIYSFARIHADRIKELKLDGDPEDQDFDVMSDKTKIATKIIRRLQLVRRGEDILNAVMSNEVNEDYIYTVRKTMNDSVSQIILLSELYVGLRSTRRTNQALNHLRAMELIQSDFNVFFNPDIIKRFIRYQREIEMAFDK